MALIGAGTLTSLRRINNDAMPTLVTVNRDGYPIDPPFTMPDGTPLRCRVSVDRPIVLPFLDALTPQVQWRITVPDDTPVLAGDTLTTAIGTYVILVVLDPSSYTTGITLLALQLTDATGTPIYLRPNCTVDVTRQNSTPATNGTGRRVRIVDTKATMERLMPYGEVGDRLLLDVMGADYRRSDIVTIVTFGSSNEPIGFADYVVQATPVGNSESGVEWLEVWLRGHADAPNG